MQIHVRAPLSIADFGLPVADCSDPAPLHRTNRQSAIGNRQFPRSQGVISAARRSAKAEVRGANPRESATLIYDLRIGLRPEIGFDIAPARKSAIGNRQFRRIVV